MYNDNNSDFWYSKYDIFSEHISDNFIPTLQCHKGREATFGALPCVGIKLSEIYR